MSSEVFEIKPAEKDRNNRPRNKAEKNERRKQNRAALAAKSRVARSLRPNEWLQQDCAEGKPDALIIRDEWRFKMPGNAHRPAPTCTRAEPALSEEQASRAVLYQNYMVQARAFGYTMASVNDTLAEMDLADEAAQDFALEIWRDLLDGKYEEQGKFQHYLKSRWGWFLQSYVQKLWDERDNFSGIQSESFNEKTGKPHGLDEGYVSEAAASKWVHRADHASQLLRAHVDRELSKLSENNQSLARLYLELGAPTQERFAKALGVSKRTIQRRLTAARKEGTDHAAKTRNGIVVNMSAAADTSEDFERLLTPAEAAKLLRLHPVTLLRWAREGKVPHRRFGQRKVLFPQSQLTAWVESGYTDAAVRAA